MPDYKKLNPIDDKLFSKMAEEKAFCEEIIRVILGDPKLEVLNHQPQTYVTNLKARSVQLDALCRLSSRHTLRIERAATSEYSCRSLYLT